MKINYMPFSQRAQKTLESHVGNKSQEDIQFDYSYQEECKFNDEVATFEDIDSENKCLSGKVKLPIVDNTQEVRSLGVDEEASIQEGDWILTMSY